MAVGDIGRGFMRIWRTPPLAEQDIAGDRPPTWPIQSARISQPRYISASTASVTKVVA
jgi:hypothetical protein